MSRVKMPKTELWKRIRLNCLECVCNSAREVDLCTSLKCKFYQIRYGRTPRNGDLIYSAGSCKSQTERGIYHKIGDSKEYHADSDGNLTEIRVEQA